MSIGGEGMENLLVNMVLNFFFQKTCFHAFLLVNGLNKLQFGIVQVTTYGYGI
jgi:hypothetical protein